MWKFGLQTKSGGRSKFEIENTETFIILKYKIYELTNIPPEKQLLKTGRPPKVIEVQDESIQIKEVGNQLQNMDLIIVDEGDTSALNAPPTKRIKTSSTPSFTSLVGKSSASNHQVFSSKIGPQNISSNGGMITRKVIPANNSCLFGSILHCLKPELYKLNKSLSSMDLRMICSDRVKTEVQENDCSTLMECIIAESDGNLKSAEDYSKRILNSDSWGGYVECKILSEYFRVQIVAGNIEIGTFNKYPDDNSFYDARIYILYDGIHYDACERGGGISIFNCDDTSVVYNEVAMVMFDLKEKRQFTNTNTFALVCQECNTGLEGQTEAREHAKKTGHKNFVQK